MLDKACRQEIERLGLQDGRLLVAVSGGRDSIVLLDLLARLAPEAGLELVVGHVNHHLRQAASDADEAHVVRTATALGLRSEVRHVAPESERIDHSSRTRPTLEEAARNLRRAALDEIAIESECQWVATAHHAGDQAETLLLRILRGTGPDGLAGIAAVSADGRWVRPLLGTMPEQIADWAGAQQLSWRDDDSNRDLRFTRNRLRHEVIPSLSQTFNPQLLRTLGDLAEAGRRDLEWIEALVEAAAKERIELAASGTRFAIDGWEGVPEALARRLVRRALVGAGLGRDVSRAHLERVLAFLRRGRSAGRDRKVQLPGGFVLRRRDEFFELATESGENGFDANGDATVLGRD